MLFCDLLADSQSQSRAPETVDEFEPITEESVKKYQASKGIETTGTVGPITRAALNQE